MRESRWPLAWAAIVTFALAVTIRLGHFYWSALPATIDGFVYVSATRTTLAANSLPIQGFRADNLLFTVLVSVWSTVLGGDPLYLIQPLAVLIGGISCLIGVALVSRIGRGWDWPRRRVILAAGTVGVLLAVQGLYLRRTSIPDSDIISFLFIPLLGLAFYQFLTTRRWAWAGVSLLFVGVFPITHTFSTFVAGLVLVGVLAGTVMRQFDRWTFLVGALSVLGFWGFVAAYYTWAGNSTALVVPFVDRVTAFPGLFVAWVILLVTGVIWVRTTTPHLARIAFLFPTFFLFVAFISNSFLTVFPGTIATPRPLLGLVVALIPLTIFAAWHVPQTARNPDIGLVIVALFAAPLVIVFFSLTASLTPEYFATALRAQTFLHLPVLVLAALTVGALLVAPDGTWRESRRWLRIGAICLLVVSTAFTAPVAFVALDTLSVPAVTPPSEFEAISWASTHTEGWTSDRSTVHIGNAIFADGTAQPTRTWLQGGPAPDMPVIARRVWIRGGAHFFPTGAMTIDEHRYNRWMRSEQKIYDVGGIHGVSIVVNRSQV